MSINPLPVSPNQVDSDAMRTKINELISDNSSVTVADTPPASPGEGDLWFDVDNAATYVYVGNPTNAWIQANSGAGSSGIVQSNATTSEDGLMSSEDKAKLDGMSSGGAINRYVVTSMGSLYGLGAQKNVGSLGTGITVPSGISSVFIFGAEMTSNYSHWDGFGAGGASIPHNTGIKHWNQSAYVNLQGGSAGDGAGEARVYWGMSPTGAGQVDNKIYVNCTPYYTVTSIFLMFI